MTVDVIAVDPGSAHVGLAWLTAVRRERLPMVKSVTLPPAMALAALPQIMDLLDYPVVVVERFRMRMRGFNSFKTPTTAILIGQIQALAEDRGLDVVMQDPSCKDLVTKTPFWRDVGPTLDSIDRHGRDAVGHLVYHGFMGSGRERTSR